MTGGICGTYDAEHMIWDITWNFEAFSISVVIFVTLNLTFVRRQSLSTLFRLGIFHIISRGFLFLLGYHGVSEDRPATSQNVMEKVLWLQ